MNGNGVTERVAGAIYEAFDAYHAEFRAITRRGKGRFERRDWHGILDDARDRLACYTAHLQPVLHRVRAMLGAGATDVPTWQEIRWMHSALIVDREDYELAETFFNSVTRRIFATVGVNERVEYVLSDTNPDDDDESESRAYRTYPRGRSTAELVSRVLTGPGWHAPWADLDGDCAAVAERIDAETRQAWGTDAFDGIEMLACPFVRNKAAYLVGRVFRGNRMLPLLLPLLHDARGIRVDAVLLSSNEVSIVFGFSWSYFLADVQCPRATVEFLATLMPLKRVDELYNAIGYTKHGKTELYRTLVRHLGRDGARFGFAPGAQGLVMSVFTLPSLNVVFKIIKDTFGHPKRTTRREVMEHYRLVFIHDRVGRLADAQEFEHLQLPRRCFPDELMEYLLEVAPSAVRVEGEHVIVRHLYTERRVTPLNVYLQQAEGEPAEEAILDYGLAIKELAGANIFTGDMLLKNFGVSRHGRVIFYDYDELCLLTDCTIRRLPQAANPVDELSPEPWFGVSEHDIFPEEFAAFLVPAGRLGDVFRARHGDLLTVEYWTRMQARQRAGEIADVFPYRDARRLHRVLAPAAADAAPVPPAAPEAPAADEPDASTAPSFPATGA